MLDTRVVPPYTFRYTLLRYFSPLRRARVMDGAATDHSPVLPDMAAERALVARIRAGDEAAFETLFLAHYEGMCALAYSLVRSREAAEDIVSNVFRSLWKRRHEWHPVGPVRTYLLTATRNEALNLLRRIKRERALEEELVREDVLPAFGVAAALPDDEVATKELLGVVEQVVAELPPRCRDVFLLRWSEGLKYREIAERLGIEVKTVEMYMTRAMRAIRERLGDER